MKVTGALTLCLCLGIAVDDTIHVVERFRKAQQQGRSSQDSCLLAYRSVGKAIVLTTVILVCGFATMLFSSSPAIQLFGELCCVALVAALTGDLVSLPALLVRFSACQVQRDQVSNSAPAMQPALLPDDS